MRLLTFLEKQFMFVYGLLIVSWTFLSYPGIILYNVMTHFSDIESIDFSSLKSYDLHVVAKLFGS